MKPGPNPDSTALHVHVLLCGRGVDGRAPLNERDSMQAWREVFAERLRDQGIDVEATTRLARGITRKSEKSAVYRLKKRAAEGQGPWPKVMKSAYREAFDLAFRDDNAPRIWEERLIKRQEAIRGLYVKQGLLLLKSADPEERALGSSLLKFVQDMPLARSQRQEVAQQMKEYNDTQERERAQDPGRGRSR